MKVSFSILQMNPELSFYLAGLGRCDLENVARMPGRRFLRERWPETANHLEVSDLVSIGWKP